MDKNKPTTDPSGTTTFPKAVKPNKEARALPHDRQNSLIPSNSRELESDEELQERIRAIIKAPIRSKISTADIAVGYWSSLDLSEKVRDLEQLIKAREKQSTLAAQLDILETITGFGYSDDLGTYDYDAIAENALDTLEALRKHQEHSNDKATCRTCGATGPPWNHLSSTLDPDGVGDPGHKIDNLPGLHEPEGYVPTPKSKKEVM